MGGEALLDDPDFVLAAVRCNWRTLRFAKEGPRGDREIVVEAIRQDGMALGLASEALKADREGVLEAVRREGWALRYACSQLRKDEELLQEAAKSCPESELIRFAGGPGASTIIAWSYEAEDTAHPTLTSESLTQQKSQADLDAMD